MNAIGHDFHCHIINQINTFYRTFILIFLPFVKSGHSIVEMCSMRISCLIRSLDIFKFSLCMSYRCQYAFCGDILSELHSPRKFRCRIPTFDAMGFFQQRDILFRIRIFDILRNLSACHLHIEVMSFQMQTEYGTVRLCHHLFSCFCGCTDHRNSRRRKCGENTGSSVLHVSFNRCPEGVFRPLHKVSSTTAMNMNFYSSRNDIHALGINQFCSDNRQVAVSHFQNFMITNKYGPILQPALRGKDARINDLC